MRDNVESRADLLAERSIPLLCGMECGFGPQNVIHEHIDGSLAIYNIGMFLFLFRAVSVTCRFAAHTHTHRDQSPTHTYTRYVYSLALC